MTTCNGGHTRKRQKARLSNSPVRNNQARTHTNNQPSLCKYSTHFKCPTRREFAYAYVTSDAARRARLAGVVWSNRARSVEKINQILGLLHFEGSCDKFVFAISRYLLLFDSPYQISSMEFGALFIGTAAATCNTSSSLPSLPSFPGCSWT